MITMNNLPNKFHPFLLGHPSCSANCKNEIDAIFNAPLIPLKGNYIFDAGNWVLSL